MSDTDREIFDAAMSETPADTVAPAAEGTAAAPPATEQPATGGEQPRDEAGRFAPKTTPEAKPVEAKPDPASPQAQPKDEQGGAIPSWRLREVSEARQAAEQRALAAEQQAARLAEYVRQLNEKPKETPDFYADPDAALNHRLNPMKQEFQEEIGRMREGFSKQFAIEKHGEDAVNAAYAELAKHMGTGAGQLDYVRIMRSQHPYGELVKWHKELQARQTVGDDPNAWFEKQLEERMKDPAFQSKQLERIRSQANGGNGTNGHAKSANPVSLPPSLSKVPSAASRTADGDTDMSDAGLFRHAMR